MLTKIAIIKQAANLKASKSELPNSAEVVANLLELEKEFKQEKEAKFPSTEIKHQAFFSYFLIEDNLIAARGRGGGLAFWRRDLINDL